MIEAEGYTGWKAGRQAGSKEGRKEAKKKGRKEGRTYEIRVFNGCKWNSHKTIMLKLLGIVYFHSNYQFKNFLLKST